MKILAIVLVISSIIVMFTVFLGTILTMKMETKGNDIVFSICVPTTNMGIRFTMLIGLLIGLFVLFLYLLRDGYLRV